MGDHLHKDAFIPLSWDLLQQFIPEEDDFGLHQLHLGPINESIDQLGNLGSEPHPVRPPGPPIGCLSNALESPDIGQEPLLLVPFFLLHVLVQELPYIEEGRQMGVLDTFPTHLQAAKSHLVRSFAATSLPSVSGLTSGHQLISSSSPFMQACSHLVVCHIGSTCWLVGEHHIILC